MRNARQPEAASDAARVLKREVDVCGHGAHIHTSYLGGPGWILSIGGPILRISNARQSEAASDAARVFKHEMDLYGHGEIAHRRYLGGSGGECSLLEVPFCEYAMQGSPRPHPTLLLSSNTKWAVTADMSVISISEGPGVNIAYLRSKFANTQCEAVRGRIPLCWCLQT